MHRKFGGNARSRFAGHARVRPGMGAGADARHAGSADAGAVAPHKETIRLRIEKLVPGGEGLGFAGGKAIFVGHVCAGEMVDARITHAKESHAKARLISVLEPSPDRCAPPCPYYFKPGAGVYCGGCDWQHIDYAAQCRAKKSLVEEAFRSIGGMKISADDTAPAPSPFGYRNKMDMPVGRGPKKHPVVGFFSPGSHEIVDVEKCIAQSDGMNAVLAVFRNALSLAAADAGRKIIYSEDVRKGCLRHFVLREGSEGKIIAGWVSHARTIPGEEILIKALAAVPGVVGVFKNLNPVAGNVIFGDRTLPVSGSPELTHVVLGKKFHRSPTSFFQVNALQLENLVKFVRAAVLDEAAPAPDGILDLYCGVGLFGIILSGDVGWVEAVEGNRSAVEEARRNASVNGAKNFRAHAEGVEKFLEKFQPVSKNWTAIVDPPRAGMEREPREHLLRLRPARIVYVSCNPPTLARDAKQFCAGGYRITGVKPVDMFPQTAHVEVVCRMDLEK